MRVISGLPQGVIADGSYYPVNTSFRVWLKFGGILERDDETEAAKAMRLCYRGEIPISPAAAFSALIGFFLGGEEPCAEKPDGGAIFSFDADEELIYSSFYSQYGLDLSKAELHWWQFLALLRGLDADTPLMRTAAIRAANPADIKDPAARRRLIIKKREVAIGTQAEADVGAVLDGVF